MSTSTMRSEHGDTRSEDGVPDAPVARVDSRRDRRACRRSAGTGEFRVETRVRRFISTILFGSDAVTML